MLPEHEYPCHHIRKYEKIAEVLLSYLSFKHFMHETRNVRLRPLVNRKGGKMALRFWGTVWVVGVFVQTTVLGDPSFTLTGADSLPVTSVYDQGLLYDNNSVNVNSQPQHRHISAITEMSHRAVFWQHPTHLKQC